MKAILIIPAYNEGENIERVWCAIFWKTIRSMIILL